MLQPMLIANGKTIWKRNHYRLEEVRQGQKTMLSTSIYLNIHLYFYSNTHIKETIHIRYHKMNELLLSLYSTYVATPSQLTRYLTSLSTVSLPNAPISITPTIFAELQLLICKQFVSYSQSNMTIKLNAEMLMWIGGRSVWIEHWVKSQGWTTLSDITAKWRQSEGMPVSLKAQEIEKIFGKKNKNTESQKEKEDKHKDKEEVKGRKKKQKIEQKPINHNKNKSQTINENENQLQIDFTAILIQYSANTYILSISEITHLYRSYLIIEYLGLRLPHLQKQYSELFEAKFDFWQVYRQNRVERDGKRAQWMLNLMKSIKKDIVEEWMLATFSKWDKSQKKAVNQIKSEQMHEIQEQPDQQPTSQCISKCMLLVFNLLSTYPYLSEKQLQSFSLLSLSTLRTSLTLLLSHSLITPHPESIRSMLFRPLGEEELHQKCINDLASGIIRISSAELGAKGEWRRNKIDQNLCILGY